MDAKSSTAAQVPDLGRHERWNFKYRGMELMFGFSNKMSWDLCSCFGTFQPFLIPCLELCGLERSREMDQLDESSQSLKLVEFKVQLSFLDHHQKKILHVHPCTLDLYIILLECSRSIYASILYSMSTSFILYTVFLSVFSSPQPQQPCRRGPHCARCVRCARGESWGLAAGGLEKAVLYR